MTDNKPIVLEGEVVENSSALTVPAPRAFTGMRPVFDIAVAKKRLAEFQEFVKDYLVPEEDYGQIPGTPKPTLYKSGADKLCELYGLADSYEFATKTEAWDREPVLFDYTIVCKLTHIQSGALVASGMGSCSSYEGKYRYRDNKRKCPTCSKETIIKGRAEFSRGQVGYEDGGWVCWKKEGKSDGCGAKFPDNETAIASQVVGKIENEDLATLKNTVLKMAKKRAKVDATLAATRSSGIFTQDVEDMGEVIQGGSKAAAQAVAQSKIAQAQLRKVEKADEDFKKQLPIGTGTLEKVVVGATQAKKPFLKLTVNGHEMSSFDNFALAAHLTFWELLGYDNESKEVEERYTKVGSEVVLIVSQKGNYTNVHGIRKMKVGDVLMEWEAEEVAPNKYSHTPVTQRGEE